MTFSPPARACRAPTSSSYYTHKCLAPYRWHPLPPLSRRQDAGQHRSCETTASAADNRTVRVAAQKLDSLITHIGELITAAAGANLTARRSGNAELQESTSRISALIEQVREGALQLRMVKIGGTFSRFQRVVHDVSAELGKQIQLEVSGEDAELDKTVVEQIADPLTHLVRNAIDHGIEAADVRASRGKPLGGTIKLNAFHDSAASSSRSATTAAA